MIESFPLCWPHGRPRYPDYKRTWSAFKATFSKARDRTLGEIRMLGGKEPIISTNLPLRMDGLPYAARGGLADPGVAVYFTYKGKPMCFACDRWTKVDDNMHAVALTIGALRGIARWGTGDMMQAAFTGFTALPAPGQSSGKGWREILTFEADSAPKLEEVSNAYRKLRSQYHPDKPGGSAALFDSVQRAWELAQQELLARTT